MSLKRILGTTKDVVLGGAAVAGLTTALLTADPAKSLETQFKQHSQTRLKNTRRDIRERLDQGSRLKSQPTTSLIAKDLKKLGKSTSGR